jgi:hypothetical protein
MKTSKLTPEVVEEATEIVEEHARRWLLLRELGPDHVLDRLFMLMGTAFSPPSADWMFGGPPDNFCEYDDEKGKELIKRALDGNEDAGGALAFIAAIFIREERELPPHLRQYVAHTLMDKFRMCGSRKKGGGKRPNAARDFAIVALVSQLKRIFPATRRGGKGPTACSIVAAGLKRVNIHISENGVETIWRRKRATNSVRLE